MNRGTHLVETQDGMLPNPGPRTGTALAGLAIATVFMVQVAAVWRFTVDDAYITLRYARELAAGHGPVYQVGAPPAEGCSTFLWMALMALPHALRLDAVWISKGAGVLATLALLVLVAGWTIRIVRGDHDAPRAALPGGRDGTWRAGASAAVAALALACYPATAVHAVSGMESALFALLLLALFVLCGEVAGDSGGRLLPWLAPLALALGLTRPEGNLAALLALGTTLAMMPAPLRGRFLRWLLAGYLAPGAIYFLWRWNYYGELLPLPFYLKLSSPQGLPGGPRVISFMTTFAVHLGVLLALALARPPRPLWPALAAGAGLLVFFLFPAHVMGYHARYLFPLAPLLCVLAGLGARPLEASLGGRALLPPGRARPVALALATLLSLSLLSGAARTALDRRRYADGLARAHVALGRRPAALPRGTLAIADAGAVPYLSDWRTIDLLGLNDRHIATTGRHDPDYVLGQHPDVVVLASAAPDRLVPLAWDPGSIALARACVAEGMSVVARYEFHPRYHLLVMMRRRDPRARELAGDPPAGPASPG